MVVDTEGKVALYCVVYRREESDHLYAVSYESRDKAEISIREWQAKPNWEVVRYVKVWV